MVDFEECVRTMHLIGTSVISTYFVTVEVYTLHVLSSTAKLNEDSYATLRGPPELSSLSQAYTDLWQFISSTFP